VLNRIIRFKHQTVSSLNLSFTIGLVSATALNYALAQAGIYWICYGIKCLCYIRVSKCGFGYINYIPANRCSVWFML